MSIMSPYDTSDFRPCISHHHACDCREWRVAKLVEALEFYSDPLKHNLMGEVNEDHGAIARAALDEWRKG